MPVNVTYYFLYLLEATDSYREKFDDISERVRVETDNLKKLYPDLYLFSWDKIPGNDNGRLVEFLKQNFGIDWTKTAKFEKTDDGKTIRVCSEKNSLSLRLDNEKTKANLKIDDGRTDEFIAKTENGKLNIYTGFIGEPVNNSEDWCKLTGTIDSGKAEVKYYKERIILTVDTKFDTENLNELFKKAKIKRDKLLENVFVKSIEENLCSLCQDCIRSVYLYPLIEIYKDYKQTNFKLNDEAITTLTLSD